MEDENARALKENSAANTAGTSASSLQELALGSAAFDPAHAEVFPISDLGDMPLATYLVEGAGVDPETLQADRFKLTSLEGWIMVVYSSAFKGRAQTLTPSAQVTLVGAYPQEGVDWTAPVDLSTPSALPQAPDLPEPEAPKRPSDAAMSGRIAMLALVVAFLVVGLMIWVGG
jgi:hypothetical protein